MRPHDLDVTFVLHHLDCFAAEDTTWDEPYIWNLAFKVDADTITPQQGSLLPSLNVQTFEGVTFPTFVVGARSVKSGDSPPIAPPLGTRSFRLRPALLDVLGWFPGIAGNLCLLWDQDGFSPATSDAGFKAFKKAFGPALGKELNRLTAGDYDNDLAKDQNGNAVPMPPGGADINWRLQRLADSAGRANGVKAITANVKDAIMDPVKKALKKAAGWDELADPDDLLGVDAKVFLGSDLSGTQDFTLSYTDDDANYAIRGFVTASSPHRAVLSSVVLRNDLHLDRVIGAWLRVCWGPLKLYWAQAFKADVTIRFEIKSTLGEPPASVRWFIDGQPIADGASTMPVTYDPTDAHFGPPQDQLASFYPGGPGTIACNAAGPVLDVSNQGGDGVYFGEVHALYAYPRDPSLFSPNPLSFKDLLARGYDQAADLDIMAVQLTMNDDYAADVSNCMKKIKEIDRKRIPPDFGKGPIGPGDPPNWRELVEYQLHLDKRLDRALAFRRSIPERELDRAPGRVMEGAERD